MEPNILAAWSNSTAQQHQLNTSILGNTACFTQENTAWGYPRFYSRFHTNCTAVSSCKYCRALVSYPTSQVSAYVPRQQAKLCHGIESQEKTPNAKDLLTLGSPTSQKSAEMNQRNWCVTEGTSPPTDHRSKFVKTAKHECVIPGCGKTYERLSHLKAHLRWHGNPAPFKCQKSSCGKRFSSEDKLDSHKKTHEKDKQCDPIK